MSIGINIDDGGFSDALILEDLKRENTLLKTRMKLITTLLGTANSLRNTDREKYDEKVKEAYTEALALRNHKLFLRDWW
jgi:hypothetical protein